MTFNNEAHPFTREELDKAERLHASGLHWTVVAERIGHTYWSLMATRTKIKKGKYNFNYHDRNVRERAYTEELVSLGAKAREIARALRVSASALSNRFAKWGLDREMRVQLRVDSSETVRTLIAELQNHARARGTGKLVYDSALHATVEKLMGISEINMNDISRFLRYSHKLFGQQRNRYLKSSTVLRNERLRA